SHGSRQAVIICSTHNTSPSICGPSAPSRCRSGVIIACWRKRWWGKLISRRSPPGVRSMAKRRWGLFAATANGHSPGRFRRARHGNENQRKNGKKLGGCGVRCAEGGGGGGGGARCAEGGGGGGAVRRCCCCCWRAGCLGASGGTSATAGAWPPLQFVIHTS